MFKFLFKSKFLGLLRLQSVYLKNLWAFAIYLTFPLESNCHWWYCYLLHINNDCVQIWACYLDQDENINDRMPIQPIQCYWSLGHQLQLEEYDLIIITEENHNRHCKKPQIFIVQVGFFLSLFFSVKSKCYCQAQHQL